MLSEQELKKYKANRLKEWRHKKGISKKYNDGCLAAKDITAYKAKRKEYRDKYKEEYKAKYKAKYKIYDKEYREKHKEEYREYIRTRMETDSFFRAISNLRCRVRMAFKRIKAGKPTRTRELLGIDYQTVLKHIEQQFTEGMEWGKIGKEIHIDHVIPLSSAKDLDELIALCHYSNLQPLWAEDNLRKSNKLNWNRGIK